MCARTTAGRSSGLDQHAGGMPLDGCDATTAMHWYPRMGMCPHACCLLAWSSIIICINMYGKIDDLILARIRPLTVKLVNLIIPDLSPPVLRGVPY